MMSEGSGTGVKDSSGYGNDGDMAGHAPTWVSPGRFPTSTGDSMLKFNGTSEYISIPNDPSLSFGTTSLTKSFTIEAWFMTFDYSTTAYIFSKGYGGGASKWYGLYTHGNAYVRFSCDDGVAICHCGSFGGFLRTYTWYHVVGINDEENDSMTMYINGILGDDVDTCSSGGVANTQIFTIGRRADLDPNRYFTGYIDEVRMYDRVFTADEARAHYNGGRQKP